MNMDTHRKERHRITKVAIWKGVESLKRSWTFLVTACPYTEASSTITSSSGSFSSGSSNTVALSMRASKEGGDDRYGVAHLSPLASSASLAKLESHVGKNEGLGVFTNGHLLGLLRGLNLDPTLNARENAVQHALPRSGVTRTFKI